MASAGYRIADEPRPSGLTHLVVSPVWCLFAIMFGGVWVSWPWFLLNAKAIGSPNLGRDVLWLVLGLLGLVGLSIGALFLSKEAFGYYFVLIIGLKLVLSYRLYISQARAFELYQYFGGPVRNGVLVVVAGAFLRGAVLPETSSPLTILLLLVLS